MPASRIWKMNPCPIWLLIQKKEVERRESWDCCSSACSYCPFFSYSIFRSDYLHPFSPPTTRVKGKGKVGRSVWDDLATAIGHAYNVITDDELKGWLSIPSHELVSCHIHKLVHSFSLSAILWYFSVCMVSFLICLFLSGPWGVIAHHDWLFEHGREGCGG